MDAQPNNKIAYITGCSKGIGNAIALELLNQSYHVIGLSRTNTIEHPNFSFISLDLSDLEAVKNFTFTKTADEVILINNAGIIGEIKPIGQVKDQSIERVMHVNTIAPQILMNRFSKSYQNKIKKGHIINISSGAGKRPMDAWASYCASKAALDLFSKTMHEEWQNRQLKNWYIHAVAPGVVDTAMQTEIRKANPIDFKLHSRFENLKREGELFEPKIVAKKIMQLIEKPNHFKAVSVSVRDM